MKITPLAQQLINAYQRGFPLCNRPFLALAQQLLVSEQAVIDCLQDLQDNGVLSRLGPVFDHQKAGASTLAALCVPQDQLEHIASLVNSFAGVNHNYARTHDHNLWFVVTAATQIELDQMLIEIEQVTGFEVLILPMTKAYHLDLAFTVEFDEVVHE